jgi:triosephosphate isomerase
MRQPLVVGNWKMHGSRDSVAALLGDLVDSVTAGAVEVAVCPAYVHLSQALELCASTSLAVGAQDCSAMASGAYTGEVSAAMVADLGCQWVILGHSERRAYHAESDELIAAKLAAAIDAGLTPILCVGETREQREAGEAEGVVAGQLRGWLLPTSLFGQLALA